MGVGPEPGVLKGGVARVSGSERGCGQSLGF